MLTKKNKNMFLQLFNFFSEMSNHAFNTEVFDPLHRLNKEIEPSNKDPNQDIQNYIIAVNQSAFLKFYHDNQKFLRLQFPDESRIGLIERCWNQFNELPAEAREKMINDSNQLTGIKRSFPRKSRGLRDFFCSAIRPEFHQDHLTISSKNFDSLLQKEYSKLSETEKERLVELKKQFNRKEFPISIDSDKFKPCNQDDKSPVPISISNEKKPISFSSDQENVPQKFIQSSSSFLSQKYLTCPEAKQPFHEFFLESLPQIQDEFPHHSLLEQAEISFYRFQARTRDIFHSFFSGPQNVETKPINSPKKSSPYQKMSPFCHFLSNIKSNSPIEVSKYVLKQNLDQWNMFSFNERLQYNYLQVN
jgi:hypothetical protein